MVSLYFSSSYKRKINVQFSCAFVLLMLLSHGFEICIRFRLVGKFFFSLYFIEDSFWMMMKQKKICGELQKNLCCDDIALRNFSTIIFFFYVNLVSFTCKMFAIRIVPQSNIFSNVTCTNSENLTEKIQKTINPTLIRWRIIFCFTTMVFGRLKSQQKHCMFVEKEKSILRL